MINNKSQRVFFFGSGYYTIPIVEKIKEHGLVLVVTTDPAGEFVDYLKKENIPYIYSKLKKEEDILRIKGVEPDLGILASYGAIIPREILYLFLKGILNIHPSLLPKYKGPSPVQYAILNGDTKSGTTIIKLDEKIDHGPIVEQEEIALFGNETLKNLTEKLFTIGREMIIEIVQKIEDGLPIKETKQDSFGEVFTKKITKDDGFINLDSPPAPDQLERMIRAYYPWPGVWFHAPSLARGTLANKIIKLLPQGKLQVEGKNIMSLKDFENGYPEGQEILKKLNMA